MRVAGICRDINWPEGLRGEVIEEIEAEEKLLERLSQPMRGMAFGHVLIAALLAGSIALILLMPAGALAWFVVAFLLYSFNFVILFIPTTRRGERDESCRRTIGRDALEPVRYLLRKKRKLAMEVGITMFLGGMVPLALSFFVLFGVGLFLALYFTFVVIELDQHLAWVVIGQILIILLFFVVMVLTRPDVQGPTRIARSIRDRYEYGRERGRWYRAAIVTAIGLAAVGLAMLFVGAILLTGGVLGEVFDVGGRLGFSLLVVLLVLVVQVLVMRHFQAISSRRMARTLVERRLVTLRRDVLEPLIALLDRGKFTDEQSYDKDEFERIKVSFFSTVIYGVYELNFFGFSPVYIVGPNVKYLIDERVLPYVSGP